MNVGLLGGSFDPVHAAHLALGRLALDALQLDELRWLPAGNPWQKASLHAVPDDRLAMLRLALEGEPRFVIDDRELHRAGPSYTLDTVRELQAEQPDVAQWFLVIGGDQFARFSTWHGWRELVDRVTLAVAAREGEALAADPALAESGATSVVLPLPRHDISSTALRARLARGEGVASMVPPAVARYIAERRLYQGTPGS